MPWDKSSPLIPITPLLPKILLKKFKTYDKRFVAVLADVDLYMRLIRGNVDFIFCDIFYIENKSINAGNLLLNDHWSKDKIMLDELWIDDITKPLEERKFANIRKDEVSEFSHIDINISTQGPKGKWKYNSSFYNSIIHSAAVLRVWMENDCNRRTKLWVFIIFRLKSSSRPRNENF